MFESIRLRLTAWYALVMMIVLIAAGLVTYAITRDQLQRSLDRSLQMTARQFASALGNEAAEVHGDLPAAAKEILNDFRDSERAIAVLDRNGRTIAAHQIRLTGKVRVRRTTVIIAQTPIAIVIVQSLASQKETLAETRNAMLIAIPIAIIIAAIGGYFLAGRSLQPVAEMSAAQQRFMADASHELRSPVAILQGELDVTLSRDDRDAASYRESLEVMRRTVRRLGRIVQDLFLLARSDAGELPARRDRVDLGETIGQAVRAFRSVAAEKDVTLTSDCTGELVITGDEDLLQRMVGNLIDNAIRHTRPQTEVSIRCSSSPLRIEVTDQGPGIPPELHEKIFERFYRVDAARSGHGAGLGLPIARWIAEAHGYTLEVQRSDESGTTFVVRA